MTIRSTLAFITLFLLLISSSFTINAQEIIAEETVANNGYTGLINVTDPEIGSQYQEVGQTFQSLLTATIGEINFYMQNVNQPGNVNLEIYSCSAANSWGSLLGTKTGVSISNTGWVSVDVSDLDIPVTAGNYYGFRLIPQSGLNSGIGQNNNLYPDGEGWYNGGDGNEGFTGQDYSFSVTSADALPVKLTSFIAQKQDKSHSMLLQWSTATEQNSKSFTIQRSSNSITWNNIASLPAAGNSYTVRNYSYIDFNPGPGRNYYRLLETDVDGKISYSGIRTASFDPGLGAAFSLIVNPVSDGTLQVKVNEATILSLYSPGGQLLWTKHYEAGMQYIDVSGYAGGVYFLRGKHITEKVVIR